MEAKIYLVTVVKSTELILGQNVDIHLICILNYIFLFLSKGKKIVASLLNAKWT